MMKKKILFPILSSLFLLFGSCENNFDAHIYGDLIQGKYPSTEDEYVSYMILEISKSISMKRVKVKFDRKNFIDKIINLDFPDKNNILKYFYGIESLN